VLRLPAGSGGVPGTTPSLLRRGGDASASPPFLFLNLTTSEHSRSRLQRRPCGSGGSLFRLSTRWQSSRPNRGNEPQGGSSAIRRCAGPHQNRGADAPRRYVEEQSRDRLSGRDRILPRPCEGALRGPKESRAKQAWRGWASARRDRCVPHRQGGVRQVHHRTLQDGGLDGFPR